ncbi:MAG: methyltransferase domain-containing protein [Paludibacter sp.]
MIQVIQKVTNKLKRKTKKVLKRSFLRPVIWGNLRRSTPFSNLFGYDRGSQSIARYYIDQFISDNAGDIKGTVLEIGDDTYTKRCGLEVNHSDVLHVQQGNVKATIVADLTCAHEIPDNTYNCIIMPQTIQFIYDFRSALKHTYRILKPEGVLLITLSGITQISQYDMERWGDYWRFTSLSATKLFEEFFPLENITIQAHGNVLSAVSFLEGLASRELKKSELDFNDPNYEVIITVRAVK